jgi:hypothetical protein
MSALVFAPLALVQFEASKECCGGAFSAGFVVRRIGGDLD